MEGSGSKPLTSGCGSDPGGQKNMWIRRIRNTGKKIPSDHGAPRTWTACTGRRPSAPGTSPDMWGNPRSTCPKSERDKIFIWEPHRTFVQIKGESPHRTLVQFKDESPHRTFVQFKGESNDSLRRVKSVFFLTRGCEKALACRRNRMPHN